MSPLSRISLATRHGLRHLFRAARWIFGIGLVGVAIAFLALRYGVFPHADAFRDPVARYAQRALGLPVTLGRLEAGWRGVRPELRVSEVKVLDPSGRPALALGRVEAVLSWSALLQGELGFYRLEADAPAVHVRRDARGHWWVAGLPLDQAEKGTASSAIGAWLLRQRAVWIHGAVVVWEDAGRGTAPLPLTEVELRLENGLGRHRFALQAFAPAAGGGRLEVRGDLKKGLLFHEPKNLMGELYLALDRMDVAAWRPWLPLPEGLQAGSGAARAWVTFRGDGAVAVTADVQLADVVVALSPELPAFALTSLGGRIGWKREAEGNEVWTRGLSLATPEGLRLAPTDFRFRRAGEGADAQWAIQANVLDLGVLASLARHLPLPVEAREQLAALAPRGTVFGLEAAWKGDLTSARDYRVRARFDALALSPYGPVPGFRGLSGAVEGSDQAGSFALSGKGATLELPRVFPRPLAFDQLTVQGGWAKQDEQHTEIRLRQVTFANADLAGSATGRYWTTPSGPGRIDLTARLTRAEARRVHAYLPWVVGEETREWLREALLAGRVSEAALVLKGPLEHFPFAEADQGEFRVSAKASGVQLQYAHGWPRLEEIEADLVFRGAGMEIAAGRGVLLGVRLSGVRAVIPDLGAAQPQLTVTGEARGDTNAFLRFIEESPVGRRIGDFTRGMEAAGTGRLALTLTVPLHNSPEATVEGVYTFQANRITFQAGLPPLEEVTGTLRFTDREVAAEGIDARFLGGPVRLSARTVGEEVRLSAHGRFAAEAWQARGAPGWTRLLSGTTDWRFHQVIRRDATEETLESSLEGLALALPAPLTKSTQEPLPLRVTRRPAGPDSSVLTVSLGERASAQLVLTGAPSSLTLERGALVLGPGTAEAKREGLWVTGSTSLLDLDRWLEWLPRESEGNGPGLVGFDLRVKRLLAFNRLFHEVEAAGERRQGILRLRLAGREIAGEVTWESAGNGRLTARLARLNIPSDETLGRDGAGTPPEERDLPALDIVAEHFTLNQIPHGRLELLAQPQGGLWRLHKLSLEHPDGVLTASGQWQRHPGPPRTRLSVDLAVADLGRFASRLKLGEGVRGGSGSVKGTLEWNGVPYAMDYPTLAGRLTLALDDGQFLEAEPGVAKLLGILSLQALPRRVALDFTDVFSKGFAFEKIRGEVRLAQGVAHTEALTIEGPSARVSMQGEVDLARETQNLRVRVMPSLSETAALATGVVGGPVVGLATLALSKALKDPFGQMAAFEYHVAGTWVDPQVTKIPRRIGNLLPP